MESVPALAVGAGLFEYNRGNYRFDNAIRFMRFQFARMYAIAQTGMYRADIRGLVGLQCSKAATYHFTNVISMAITTAFFCAGRLGLHSPAPPGYFLGLYLTNLACSFLLQGLSFWFSMHSSLRAQSAGVHLLTRHVRLPIPSNKELDDARQFGSGFERQRFRDIFRVPFIGMHPENYPSLSDDESYAQSESTKSGPKRSMKRSNSSPDLSQYYKRTGVPSWAADEYYVNRGKKAEGNESLAATDHPSDPTLPDHFKLYAKAQPSFWNHDIYARICMTYGFICLMNAANYYVMGTAFIELRETWIPHAATVCFSTTQLMIIKLDIAPRWNSRLPGFQYLPPLAPILAVVGMNLDYRAEYNETATALSMVLILAAHLCYFLWGLRMIDLATPDHAVGQFAPSGAAERHDPADRKEEDGEPWWPQKWKIPTSFQHVFYLVTAPETQVREDQGDAVKEMGSYSGNSPRRGSGRRSPRSRSPGGSKTGGSLGSEPGSPGGSLGSRDGTSRSRDGVRNMSDRAADMPQPWHIVRAALFMIVFVWGVLIICRVVEYARGIRAPILKQPGDPPWGRDPNKTKWNNFVPPDRLRRLSIREEVMALPKEQLWQAYSTMQEMHHALPIIESGLDKLHTSIVQQDEQEVLAELNQHLEALEARMASAEGMEDPVGQIVKDLQSSIPGGVGPLEVAWPAFFEPSVLACGESSKLGDDVLSALTPHGFGALVSTKSGQASTFALTGVLDRTPLLGASMGPTGLVPITRDGYVLECPGQAPVDGQWACRAALKGVRLPVGPAGSPRLASAAVTWVSKSGVSVPHAAVVFEDDSAVAIFSLHQDGETAQWLPVGEVPRARNSDGHALEASVSFSGADLVIITEDGAVTRVSLVDGVSSVAVSSESSDARLLWRTACSLAGGSVVRLALRPSASTVWQPEIFVSPPGVSI